ncbi:helix-turn-helix domain-containing protein [Euzebya rosea]|uniref:arsenate reductase/protein-tyrosine-phosphatase family protein n=1 Tax=Euzebya rosea TaxID=2052804 RepID=UPI000D3E90C6|nr:helix-turn-helix domain-containing protein [Euzebya rosea]
MTDDVTSNATLPDPADAARADRARVHAALGDPVRLAIVEALLDSDLAPDEVAAALGMPPNGLAHHLKVLDQTGLVQRQRSHADGRRRYLVLDRSRLDGLIGARSWTASSVLFVCTANAARSQMAAAIWQSVSTVPAASAGHMPAAAVPEATVALLRRHGLPEPADAPRGYGDIDTPPQLVVSVCDLAREAGPPFDAPRLHWSIPDPLADGRQEAFDHAFDELQRRVNDLAPRVSAA